jgi:hypothetical protein
LEAVGGGSQVFAEGVIVGGEEPELIDIGNEFKCLANDDLVPKMGGLKFPPKRRMFIYSIRVRMMVKS